jgi:hypothetical protein
LERIVLAEKKVKRKPPKGRKRGFGYERKIAKLLSLWVTNGESDKVFWRTFGSGGRFARGEASKHACGDICTEDPIGQSLVNVFSIEVKRYDELNLFDLLMPYKKRKKGNPIPNDIKWFWRQCNEDAQKADKNGWLIMKQNYYPAYMIMSISFMKATKEKFSYLTWEGNFICQLEEFIWNTKPEYLISVARNFGI